MASHTGIEKRPRLFLEAAVRNLGQWAQAWSSYFAWVMTVILIVKPFHEDVWMMSYLQEEAPANSVPAAAVRQEEQVLFRIIGRKGHVGGCLALIVPFQLLTLGLQSILFILRSKEDNRISSGEVKFLEIRRNIKSEGNCLVCTWHLGAKAWGANRIRYPGSPRRKRCWFLFGWQKKISSHTQGRLNEIVQFGRTSDSYLDGRGFKPPSH